MGGSAVAVGIPAILWQPFSYLCTLAMQAGPGGIIALAAAVAGVLWMLRGGRQRELRVAEGGRGGGEGSAGGAIMRGSGREGRGEERLRDRPRGESRTGVVPGEDTMFRGVRKVTVGVEGGGGQDNMIFSSRTAEDGSEGEGEGGRLEVCDDARTCLNKLAEKADVYLVVRVDSDEEEAEVMKALERAGLFSRAISLCRDKVVFCETVPGRVSIARQIEPQLHIDSSGQVVAALQRFIKYVALVAPKAEDVIMPRSPNVLKYESYTAFLKKC